jgi:hypothetical protein
MLLPLVLFVAIGACTGGSVALCVVGHFDAAWYLIVTAVLLVGMMLNELGNDVRGERA